MRFGPTFGLLDGHKTMTSRIPYQQWYGWYEAVNYSPRWAVAEGPNGMKRPIYLKGCTVLKLGIVKEKHYWDEGVSSPEAFEKIWRVLYKTFDPELLVCCITFDVKPLSATRKSEATLGIQGP